MTGNVENIVYEIRLWVFGIERWGVIGRMVRKKKRSFYIYHSYIFYKRPCHVSLEVWWRTCIYSRKDSLVWHPLCSHHMEDNKAKVHSFDWILQCQWRQDIKSDVHIIFFLSCFFLLLGGKKRLLVYTTSGLRIVGGWGILVQWRVTKVSLSTASHFPGIILCQYHIYI